MIYIIFGYTAVGPSYPPLLKAAPHFGFALGP